MGKKSKFKQLRKIADKLPDEFFATKKKVSGEILLLKNPDALDKKGKKIRADKIYIVPAVETKNHYKGLKSAYTKGGMNACAKYVKSMTV